VNREQMVEKAARTLWEGNAPEILPWCDLREIPKQAYRADARFVLDAVLPQVSTAAELAALAPGSIVVSHNGYPFEVTREGLAVGGEDAGTFAFVAETFAPLTVAWQP
jgi:hypothetical protein